MSWIDIYHSFYNEIAITLRIIELLVNNNT